MTRVVQNIPEGWSVKKLEDCITYFKGFAFKSCCYSSRGIRIIRVSDMGYDDITETDDAIYLEGTDAGLYKKYELITNDILITTVGSKPPMYASLVGRSIVVKSQYMASLLNQNAVCLRTRKSIVDQCYCAYLLKTSRYISFIKNIIRGNANQGSITLEDLFQFTLLLPPLPEQEKIAEVLNCWDEGIEKLSDLIESKKRLKKGLMQKLLSGKHRLKGFTQPWKEVKLEEVCSTFSGGTPSVGNQIFYDGDIPFIRSGEIHSDRTEIYISDEGLEKSSTKLVHKGDLLYALYGATSGEVDISKIDGAINQAILCIRSKQVDLYFLCFLLQNEKIIF